MPSSLNCWQTLNKFVGKLKSSVVLSVVLKAGAVWDVISAGEHRRDLYRGCLYSTFILGSGLSNYTLTCESGGGDNNHTAAVPQTAGGHRRHLSSSGALLIHQLISTPFHLYPFLILANCLQTHQIYKQHLLVKEDKRQFLILIPKNIYLHTPKIALSTLNLNLNEK